MFIRDRRINLRKVIVSEFVSLDGVAENPAWTFQFGSEEQEQYKFEEKNDEKDS